MKTTEVLKTFQSKFEENKLEEAKEYLIKYENVFEKNVYSYNRGIIDFNLANYTVAKLYLERAIKSGLDSKEANKLLKDINQNLSITRAQESVTIKDHIIETTELISTDVSLILSASLLLVGIFSLKRIYGLSLKIMTTVLTALPLLWVVFYITNYKVFVALDERELREGPSKIFEDTFNMPSGIKYIISKRYNNWAYVTYPDKYSGWLILRSKEQI